MNYLYLHARSLLPRMLVAERKRNFFKDFFLVYFISLKKIYRTRVKWYLNKNNPYTGFPLIRKGYVPEKVGSVNTKSIFGLHFAWLSKVFDHFTIPGW